MSTNIFILIFHPDKKIRTGRKRKKYFKHNNISYFGGKGHAVFQTDSFGDGGSMRASYRLRRWRIFFPDLDPESDTYPHPHPHPDDVGMVAPAIFHG
jgi:hypothetical protein